MGSIETKKEKVSKIKPNAPTKKRSKEPQIKKEYDSDSDNHRRGHKNDNGHPVKNGRKGSSGKHGAKASKNNLPSYCKNETEVMAFKRFDDDQIKAINNNPGLPPAHRNNQIHPTYIDKAWEEATKVSTLIL